MRKCPIQHCWRTMTPWLMLLLLGVAVAVEDEATFPPTAHAPGHHWATVNASCLPQERDALLEFKRGITSDPQGVLASWQRGGGRQDGGHDVGDCCRWEGVLCSSSTGHVLELQLRYNAYERLGNFYPLSGQISPSLLSLHHLEHLDLSWNNLTGPTGRVPEFLGLLKNLQHLNLSGLPFSGNVPPQLGNLSNLHFLDLSFLGDIQGSLVFSTDISWLTHLPLRHLNMRGVVLGEAVDWARVVNMVPSLRFLDLSRCSLINTNQSLPHLNLTNLEELDLSENYFKHPIASCWFWNLTRLEHLELRETHLYGQFPDALGRMTSLLVLDLSFIDSDGAIEPNSTYGALDTMTANMTNLCNLESLNLRYRNMDGDITELFERLPQCSSNKLKELQVAYNKFTGVLPNWIGRWASLLTLDLSGNQITGHVPFEIHMLNNLLILDLSGNRITGHVPSEIHMLNNLLTLDLSNNNLTGHVPSEIGTLNNLVVLYLRNNSLSGVITHEHLAGLQSLEAIDLSDNSLKIMVDPEWLAPFRLVHAWFRSCQMGPLFPTWLQSQVDIEALDISSAGIFDRLPDWFCTSFSKATSLRISKNGINGTLPRNLEALASLFELSLDSNQLTGQIPQLPLTLWILDVSMNSLSGPLPSNFGTRHLAELYVFSNLISGHIPWSICEQKILYRLNLGNNSLEGEFPQCLEMRNADVLIMNNNMLSGKFPSFLKTCTELRALDLASNQFSGQLPMWIGDFVDLEVLRLSHNMFCDNIPATITKLRSLSHLNLANNSISGALPHHLSNLTGMKRIFDDGRIGIDVNLPVITKGQERSYEIEGADMVSIDLSSNCFTGKIPEEITSLDAVVNLNLSRNYITGNIPDKIRVMHSLESLDLSENNLDGEIPARLSNLTYLSYLDLSYNNLTGRILSGGQLDTLYAQHPFMYDGNTGLCGPPLPQNCSDNSEPNHSGQKRNEDDSKMMSFYFGLSVGFVAGLWVVFCVILFKKSWRIAYFRLLDKVYDKVYVFVVVTWASLAQKTARYQAN